MENIDRNAIQMELKYCERCGGLWLRLKGSELVYCAACSVIMAGIARDPRFWEPSCPSDTEQVDDWFWGEGGRA